MDEPWLRRDYTSFWRLPAPSPPARWPRMLMALLSGMIVLAIGAGL